MTFKMKQKPSRPQRISRRERIEVASDLSLQTFIDWCSAYNVAPTDARVESDGGYGYNEGYSYYFVLDHPEPDEIYNLRLEKYNVQMEKYNRWAEENTAQIEQYKRNQADKKKAQTERDVAYLERQLEKDRKALEKMKKNLLETT